MFLNLFNLVHKKAPTPKSSSVTTSCSVASFFAQNAWRFLLESRELKINRLTSEEINRPTVAKHSIMKWKNKMFVTGVQQHRDQLRNTAHWRRQLW